MSFHIGIDFDNTIVCYDDVFHRVAREKNLIPPEIAVNKTEIRDYFRKAGREKEWSELQGFVYGERMELAKAFPGVGEFFEDCKAQEIKVSIISHKTKYPYLGPKYDLHESARNWLYKQPFFHAQIELFFEPTLEEKLKRIGLVGCTHFIDDLPELLAEPNFPAHVEKVLFDPAKHHLSRKEWTNLNSWNQGLSILMKPIKY